MSDNGDQHWFIGVPVISALFLKSADSISLESAFSSPNPAISRID
jgi:hypothetical protein